MGLGRDKDSGGIVVGSMESSIQSAWPLALARAQRSEGDTIEERVKSVRQLFQREIAMTGVAAGVVAASPGVGTVGGLAASGAQLAHATKKSVELILTIGAIHGHTRAGVDERKAWVLSVFSFGDSASAGLARFAADSSKTLGLKTTKAIPITVLRNMNKRMAASIAAKYGATRGALLFGKMLPFGVGAVIGGSSGYALTRSIALNAHKLFLNYPGHLGTGQVIDVSLANPYPPPPRPPAQLPPPPQKDDLRRL